MANILDTATAAGDFTTLIMALRAANMADLLTGAGPYTVFAPDNDAFAKINPDQLKRLLDNPAQLRTLLSYHVISGRVTAGDIRENAMTSAKTLEGENLSLHTPLLGHMKVNDASITRADVMADNGVIHVIDHVLMPEALRQQRAA